MDGNNSFDAGETFIFHIGDDENVSQINNLNINLETNSNELVNLNINVDWSEFISGIDLSVDNFAHSGTVSSTISGNGVNVISVQ